LKRDSIYGISGTKAIDIAVDQGNAVLVQLSSTDFSGTLNFMSTVDGVNFYNTSYINTGGLAGAPLIAEITSVGATDLYILPPPLSHVRINITVSSGSLNLVWREYLSPQSHVLAVQGVGADDGAAVGNPLLVGALADEASPDPVDEGDVGSVAMTLSRELYVRPSRRGAGEVKTIFTSHTSATKGTKITPATGKQVRMISLQISTTDTTATKVEVYFGAGANIASVSDTAIAKVSFPATVGERYNHVWPDGAGPIGAADAVVSVRCDGAVSNDVLVVMQWREE